MPRVAAAPPGRPGTSGRPQVDGALPLTVWTQDAGRQIRPLQILSCRCRTLRTGSLRTVSAASHACLKHRPSGATVPGLSASYHRKTAKPGCRFGFRQTRCLHSKSGPLQCGGGTLSGSSVQFRRAGFVEAVAGALAVSGLDAGQLELELTERTVMHDAEINLGTLSALDRLGVELSIDDFGTGYSSLAYLKRFPVGKLKIDRSFINELEVDQDDRAIASTIVSMGRNLRLTVLAEGVETREQLAWLKKMGCDMAQGYHFARPLPADQVTEVLRTQPFLNPE